MTIEYYKIYEYDIENILPINRMKNVTKEESPEAELTLAWHADFKTIHARNSSEEQGHKFLHVGKNSRTRKPTERATLQRLVVRL